MLWRMGSRRGIDLDQDLLICHLAEEIAAWEASEDYGGMPVGVWLTFWLADLFERGYWREGDDPRKDPQELADRVVQVGRC